MSAPWTPVVRQQVRTSDPDEAVEYLQAFTRFRAAPIDRTDFDFTLGAVSVGPLSLSRMRHRARIEASSEPPPALTVAEVLDGAVAVTGRDAQQDSDVLLMPHWSPYAASWSGSTRITTLDLDEVARIGAEVSGLAPEDVRFGSMAPLSLALADHWRRAVDHVDRGLLAHEELMALPLLRREALRQLAAAALVVFPNSTQEHRGATVAHAGDPATVRRAVEYMDSHAQDDIDITQIAEAARISPRGLQAAFRRHRGQTPLAYLRWVRMEGAHRDLREGDPTLGDSVSAIAARWGFTNPGRFSVAYRALYGSSPRHTLDR